MRHEDSVGYKMRLIHNRIHKQMEAKRIENEGDVTGMQRWTLGYLNDHADTEIYQTDRAGVSKLRCEIKKDFPDRKSKKYGCKVGCRYPGDGAAHHKRLS